MRIVTALDLTRWAETIAIGVRSALPDLVRSLVRASSPDLDYYRFPGGEAAQTHGWDGVAVSTGGSSFVPQGRSIWELGAGQDYERKANSDFAARTHELPDDQRNGHTFIFVTPRIWDTGLEAWIREHSKNGWHEVRVYDAVSLEHWLEECPAVALSLARNLGIIPPEGVRSVQEFWDDHRLNTAPPLAEELLLTGREDRAKQFREILGAGLHGPTVWKADSATEAALFIAASILRSEEELSRFLLAKTLFVDSPAGAKNVPSTGGFNLILLPVFGASVLLWRQKIK
jgi:hypothetical protein